MKIEIVSDTENNLLKRKEIRFSIMEDNGTVKKSDALAELSKSLNLSPESTIIVRLDQSFGARQCFGVAHSYKTREELERIEPKYLLSRGKPKEPKAPEAKKEEKKE